MKTTIRTVLVYSGVATDTHRRAQSTLPWTRWLMGFAAVRGVLGLCGVGWDGSGVGGWVGGDSTANLLFNQCSVFYAAWKCVSSTADCVYISALASGANPYLGFAPILRWGYHHHRKKVKKRIAVSGIPSHSYGTSLAIWDHTVLPATRHKWTRPAFTPAMVGRYSIYLRQD